MFAECGRPYSLNEPKLKFRFEDFRDHFLLELHVYKYLETSLLKVDVEPNYVRVLVKEKTFQLSLHDEIRTSDVTTQRSLTTGHLLIKMPKLKYDKINEKITGDCNAVDMTIKSNNRGMFIDYFIFLYIKIIASIIVIRTNDNVILIMVI